jgi:hypothetical protein
MTSHTALREAKGQEDYRNRADGDYRPRHREIQRRERRGQAFALLARRLPLWRRGSHGVSR